MTQTNGCRDALRRFFAANFEGYALGDDEDIFELGFVSSLFALELVEFVEGEFDVMIEQEDLDIENFQTIDHIAALIERKRTAAAAA